MGPLYRALGLTVGIVVHGMPLEARQAAYACDVTYCTNKEIAFDYLKDRLVLGRHQSRLQLPSSNRVTGAPARLRRLMLRGLCYAIVNEADSVLIDEARTPLIIAGGDGNVPEQRAYHSALELAAQLTAGRDFVCEDRERTVRLTEGGRERLTVLTQGYGGLWAGRRRREAFIGQALTALHLMHRDTHYLVKDGKVQIIDEFTGRIMSDRAWEHGLHQLIETKEGCALTGLHEPLARISYQRFFRRYLRLAGMTGTAHEVRGELWSVYRLPVVTLPTHRPPQRRHLGTRVYATTAAKWTAVVAHVKRMHASGRPILVGTRSVGASEQVSRLLTAAGLSHQVLNARQDRAEADIIAHAGEPERIVVATNMAGRGTDIRLAQGWQSGGACTLLRLKDTRHGVLIGSSLAAADARVTPGATRCSCHAKMRSSPCMRVVYGDGLAPQRSAPCPMRIGLGQAYCAGHSGVLNAGRLVYGATCSRWTSTWRRPWRSQDASNDPVEFCLPSTRGSMTL